MTFPYDDDPEGNEPDPDRADTKVTVSRRQLNSLEKKAKDFETRATKAERKLAFAEAGIPLSDAKTKYFVNGYDGELKPDEIKKAALEAGFLTEEKPVEENQQSETPPEQQLTPEQAQQAAQLQMEQQGFAPIAQATQQQDTSGRNLRAEMEKVLREGGNADSLAAWMRGQPGMYVAEDQ